MSEHDGYMVAHFPSSQGEKARLCVVVGRSFKIDRAEGTCQPEEESAPLARVDELYEGENPAESSVKRASDFEPIKQKVDLVLTGTAHAPGGKAATSWPVRLRVGKWQKELQIIGPRFCTFVPPKKKGKKKEPRPPVFTEPEKIGKVELRYENAFGGVGLFIPEDKEAFLQAQKQAREVEGRAQAKVAQPEEKPVEIPEMSDEDWDNAASKPAKEKRGDGRLMVDGVGGADVGLEPEHLRETAEGTLELDLDQVAALDAGGKGGATGVERVVDSEGTPILAIAEAGNERVVEEGWSEALVPDKAGEKPRASTKQADTDFPSIGCRSNPLGKGFAISNDREAIGGLALPLVEDPENPITPGDIPCDLQDLDSAPLPAGFGPVPRTWVPRANFAGLRPEEQEEVRARIDEHLLSLDPDDPEDKAAILALADQEFPTHDPRVHNFAPADQQLTAVKVGAQVRVEGVSPDGPFEFQLPVRFPLATLDRGGGEELLGLTLDTVEIDTDEDRVVLVWRGRVEMRDEAELLDYPHVRVRIEDVDAESARAQHAQPKRDGGTDILDVADLEEEAGSTVEGAKPSGTRPGDGAWREGEDREVSPYSDNSEIIEKADRLAAAEKAARQKRRNDVLELRARLQEAEAEKPKKKRRSKKPKNT